MKICKFEECDRPARAKGMCLSHYKQDRAGKPLTPLRHVSPSSGHRIQCKCSEECRERLRAYNREASKKYYRSHKEKKLEAGRRWRAANPERQRENDRRRRARNSQK